MCEILGILGIVAVAIGLGYFLYIYGDLHGRIH